MLLFQGHYWSAAACLIFFCFAESTSESNGNASSQLKTTSEGSNCSCRCVHKTEEGEPCENNPKRKKLVFFVDTISKGINCKCSCLASVPPNNCQQQEKLNEDYLSIQNSEIRIPLVQDNEEPVILLSIIEPTDQFQALRTISNSPVALSRITERIANISMKLKMEKVAEALDELDKQLNGNLSQNTVILQQRIQKMTKDLDDRQHKNESREGDDDDRALDNNESTEMESLFNNSNSAYRSNEVESKSISNNSTVTGNKNLSINSGPASNNNTKDNFESVDVDGMKLQLSNASMTANSTQNLNQKNNPTTSTQALPIEKEPSAVQIIFPRIITANQTTFTRPGKEMNKEEIQTTALPLSNETRHSSFPTSNDESTENFVAEKQTFDNFATPNARIPLTSHVPSTTSSTSTAKKKRPKNRYLENVGRIEFYRNSKANQAKVIQREPSQNKAYEDYYDYTEENEDNLVVHPPLISARVELDLDSADTKQTTDINEQMTKPETKRLITKTTTATTITTTATTAPTSSKNILDIAAATTTSPSSTKSFATERYSSHEYNQAYYYDSYDDEQPTSETATTTARRVTSETASLKASMPVLTPEACGTMFNLSKPRLVHDFGRREGAWMMDCAFGSENRNKIYVSNFYYGNTLIEFESLENFKNFRWSNSYMLPYNWIGTGHIVYNGSFYYNRAFSRNLIKFDLNYRFVSAWGHLRNAVYDSSTPFTWRGHTRVHMAADQKNLWVMYPAYNDFQIYSNSESYVINKINPTDLSTISSWRTSLRRNAVSHFFVVCGVVYATDRYSASTSRITYAYDTHTRVRRALYLPFSNRFSYNVQMLYNFNERKILSWDNGHQVVYDVNLTH